MKIIGAKVHGMLDYIIAVFLLAAPSLFYMTVPLAKFFYLLGAFQLLLTIFTDNKSGFIKVVPFKIHGRIELAISFLLLMAAFFFRADNNRQGFYLSITLVAVYFIVHMLTRFQTVNFNNDPAERYHIL